MPRMVLKNIKAIRQEFDWNDPAIYQWILIGTGKDVAGFVGSLVGVTLFFPAIVYCIFLAGGYIFSEMGVFRFGVAAIFFLLITIVVNLWLILKGRKNEDIRAKSSVYSLSAISLGVMAYLITSPVSFLRAGFGGNIDSIAQWILFFIDNGLRVIFLDITEIFDLKLSNIEPCTFLSKLVTLFLRLLIMTGVVELCVAAYRSKFGEQHFYGTIKEFINTCKSLLDFEGIELKRGGRMESISQSRVTTVKDFIEAFKDEAKRSPHKQ